MKCRLVASLLVGLLVVLTSCSNNNDNSGTPSGTGLLWVAAQGNNTVTSYTLDLTSGAPTQNGASIASGITPSAMVIAHDGSAIFVADKGTDPDGNYDIQSYAVSSNGSLTAGSSTPLTDASTPTSLALDPSGKILFVANQGSDNISVFSVSGTTLTEVEGSPFSDVDPLNPVATGPTSVAALSTGSFVYVANQFTNTVSAFSYDASGTLTPLSPFTYQTGTNPTSLAVSRDIVPNGTITQPHFLYTANSGSSNISGFAVCDFVSINCLTPTGQLTPLSDSPYPAGINPVYLAVNPLFDGIYAVDKGSNALSMYKWAQDTGTLTLLSPATVSTGISPTWAQVHPDGLWVYVANNGGTSISIYSVGTASPLLGPVGAGPFALQPQPSALVLR